MPHNHFYCQWPSLWYILSCSYAHDAVFFFSVSWRKVEMELCKLLGLGWPHIISVYFRITEFTWPISGYSAKGLSFALCFRNKGYFRLKQFLLTLDVQVLTCDFVLTFKKYDIFVEQWNLFVIRHRFIETEHPYTQTFCELLVIRISTVVCAVTSALWGGSL